MALPWLTPALPAQDSAPAPAVRASMDAEDAKILGDKIDKLTENYTTLQDTVNKLHQEVQRLSDEVRKTDRNKDKDTVTLDMFDQLKAKIKAVDDNRLAEQKNIDASLAELRRILEKGASGRTTAPPPVVRNNGNGNSTPNPAPGAPKDTSKLSVYHIRDGDTLAGIVNELRKGGVKISISQVQDVNPGVKWERLRIGQAIYLPVAKPSP
jgi:hypothetical protein